MKLRYIIAAISIVIVSLLAGCKGQQQMQAQVADLDAKVQESQKRINALDAEVKKLNFALNEMRGLVTKVGNAVYEMQMAEAERAKKAAAKPAAPAKGKKAPVKKKGH